MGRHHFCVLQETEDNRKFQTAPSIDPMKRTNKSQRLTTQLATIFATIVLSPNSQAAIMLTLTQDGPDVVMSLGGQTHISTATSNLGPGSGFNSGQIVDDGSVYLNGTIGFQGIYNFITPGTVTDWLLTGTQTIPVSGVGAFSMSTYLLSFGGVGVTPTGFYDYDLDATKQSISSRVANTLISDMTNTPSGTTIWTGGGGEVVLNIGAVPEPCSMMLVALSGGTLLLRRRRCGAARVVG